MNKALFLIIPFLFQPIFSQNITARLIDKVTHVPIPYATIKTGEYSGVISNEEGFFTLGPEIDETSILNISCMGYESMALTIRDIKNQTFIIQLEQAINQLNVVYISNQKPNVDSIIARIKKKLPYNYNTDIKKYSVFYRSTDYVDFDNLDFEIDKASQVKKQQLDKANIDLDKLARDIISSKTIYFSDFKADLYVINKDSSKLKVAKAIKFMDQKKDFTLDEVQNRAQNIVFKYLDTTKTYKVKTGLFKIEDSLSLKNEDAKEKNKSDYVTKDLNNKTRNLLKKSQFYNKSFLSQFLDNNLYRYSLDEIVYNAGELNYIIKYQPRKGKAKYTGKFVVNSKDYAISKIDYTYYENRHGQKFNLKLLLGVKFMENLSSGVLLYQKDENNTYQPKYIKLEEGNYFYVSRNLTLIENSRNRYKINSNFKIEGSNRSKEELLFTSTNNLVLEDYKGIKQEKHVKYQTLNKFEKKIWENEEIIEPLEEMKRFGNEE